MKRAIGLMLSLCFLISLTAQEQKSRKERKKQAQIEKSAEISELLEMQEFEFIADNATGQGGRTVNVAGNNYHLKFMKDSGSAHLPFYGRAFAGTNYGDDGGVIFHSPLDVTKVEYNEKKKMTSISARAKEDMKTFDFRIDIFENGSSTLSMRQSDKTPMTYYGSIEKIKD